MRTDDGDDYDNVEDDGWVLRYVHRNRRRIRDGSPGRPARLSHSSWALMMMMMMTMTMMSTFIAHDSISLNAQRAGAENQLGS